MEQRLRAADFGVDLEEIGLLAGAPRVGLHVAGSAERMKPLLQPQRHAVDPGAVAAEQQVLQRFVRPGAQDAKAVEADAAASPLAPGA